MGAPGLIVFDLDFTLWDCGGLWIDCVSYPFRAQPDGSIVDRDSRQIRLYPEVLEILEEVEQREIPMALASRTEQPLWARDLLDLLKIRSRFSFEQIYPGSKVTHFSKLARDSGVPLSGMLFFDDEHRNIVDVSALGVTCEEVTSGMNRDHFESGMSRFS